VLPKIVVYFFQGSFCSTSSPGEVFSDKIGDAINIAMPEQFPNLYCGFTVFFV
jgi:hypothetical protein